MHYVLTNIRLILTKTFDWEIFSLHGDHPEFRYFIYFLHFDPGIKISRAKGWIVTKRDWYSRKEKMPHDIFNDWVNSRYCFTEWRQDANWLNRIILNLFPKTMFHVQLISWQYVPRRKNNSFLITLIKQTTNMMCLV